MSQARQGCFPSAPRCSQCPRGHDRLCSWVALGCGVFCPLRGICSCWGDTAGSLQGSAPVLELEECSCVCWEKTHASHLSSLWFLPHTCLSSLLSALCFFGGCRTNPSGFWTARDCELVYRNTTHVHCQCSQFGTFGVLMDSSHREVSVGCGGAGGWSPLGPRISRHRKCPVGHEFGSSAVFPCLPLTLLFAFGSLLLQQLEGDLETLAIVTYSLVSLSLVALLLTFSFLTCLKGLKSNTCGIHSNISVTLFFSELLFLLGINRTENQVCGLERTHPWDWGRGMNDVVSIGTIGLSLSGFCLSSSFAL